MEPDVWGEILNTTDKWKFFFFFGSVYFFPLVARLYLEEEGGERERD